MNQQVNQAQTLLKGLSATEQLDTVRGAFADQSDEAKIRLLKDLSRSFLMPDPTPKTADSIWKVVIWAFVIVLIISTIALSVGMFLGVPDAATKSETMLTVITTIVGFLAGLFTPSPAGKG